MAITTYCMHVPDGAHEALDLVVRRLPLALLAQQHCGAQDMRLGPGCCDPRLKVPVGSLNARQDNALRRQRNVTRHLARPVICTPVPGEKDKLVRHVHPPGGLTKTVLHTWGIESRRAQLR